MTDGPTGVYFDIKEKLRCLVEATDKKTEIQGKLKHMLESDNEAQIIKRRF